MTASINISRPAVAQNSSVGRIFNIQKYSVQDGPGIRTTVFFKGCPLRCAWCHNPEGLSRQTSVSYSADKCIDCGECSSACSKGCHPMHQGTNGSKPEHTYMRQDCESCAACAGACPVQALELIGRDFSVEEVLREVLEDKTFYDLSGGGMTLSGGEPLAQIDFAVALLEAAKEAGLHCCVETSGYAPWDQLRRLLPLVDLYLYDYKETDATLHRAYTGQSNELILTNLKSLHDSGSSIQLQCPVVAGFNDREDHLEGITRLARSLPRLCGVRLLPYHPFGTEKALRLGLPSPIKKPSPSDRNKIESWTAILRKQNVKVLN